MQQEREEQGEKQGNHEDGELGEDSGDRERDERRERAESNTVVGAQRRETGKRVGENEEKREGNLFATS